MSTKSTIEWTDRTWNPVRGCSLVSAGCQNCYAMKFAHRFSGPGKPYEGLTELGPQGPRWTGKITLVPDALDEPLHWKSQQRIFVNSMSDLFHEDVPEKFIREVFWIMGRTSRHTYQILTKRPLRMKKLLTKWMVDGTMFQSNSGVVLPNVWLGISVEDQATADERIPILLQTPAAVRFISAEPLLGPVDLTGEYLSDKCGGKYPFPALEDEYRTKRIDLLNWVIVGGESGPGARPCDLAWIRSIKDQCQAAAVPCFVKQLGAKWYDRTARCGITGSVAVSVDGPPWTWVTQQDRKGGEWMDTEFPVDLKVREFPR